MPLRCVTYNVSHGVMSDDAGWEREVVIPCRNRYGRGFGADGLTGCARAGVEHLAAAKPDVICLQEMTVDHIGAWMDHLTRVTGNRPYACLICNDQRLTTAVVWDQSLLGTGLRISPESERVVAVYFEDVQLIVCSAHIAHEDAKRNGGTARFLMKQIKGEQRPTAQLLVMGDFNDTYRQGTTSITLCGVKATLQSHNLRTCCADAVRPNGEYEYAGDYAYASGGLPTIECRMLEDVVPRTSDHKAVLFVTAIPQKLQQQLVVGGTHFQRWATQLPCTESVHYGLVQPVDSLRVTGYSFSHALPVLIVCKKDFDMLLERTHPGAFGSDHNRLVIGDVRYVVLWKWPADMFGARTGIDKKNIEFIPLPVGRYNLLPDPWWSDQPVKGTGSPVTKWRVDTGNQDLIHYLQNDDGARIPMVTSSLFMSQLWSETDDEVKTVSNFTRRLAEQGITAFPCHGQHHAIVFYSFRDEPLYPAIFCALVEGHPPILKILADNGLAAWFITYRSYFIK